MPVSMTTSSRISVTQSTGAVVARARATNRRLPASTTTPPIPISRGAAVLAYRVVNFWLVLASG